MSIRTYLVGAVAASALMAAVGPARANTLSTTERGLRVSWLSLEMEAGESVIRCPLTLEGSFHSTSISKTSSVLVGHISRASFRGALAAGACTNGAVTVYQESLPWHIQYGGFTGSLPRPSGLVLRLVNVRFRLDPLGIFPACIARSGEGEEEEEPYEPMMVQANIEANGLVTGLSQVRWSAIPLEGGLCPFGSSLYFNGTGSVTRLGAATNIAITLIPPTPPSLSPSSYDFGTVATGSLARRTITITAGSEALTVNSIRVASGNYFAITDPRRCIGTRLAARGTCAFSVVLVAPEEAEVAVSDTVSVGTSVRTLEATVRART